MHSLSAVIYRSSVGKNLIAICFITSLRGRKLTSLLFMLTSGRLSSENGWDQRRDSAEIESHPRDISSMRISVGARKVRFLFECRALFGFSLSQPGFRHRSKSAKKTRFKVKCNQREHDATESVAREGKKKSKIDSLFKWDWGSFWRDRLQTSMFGLLISRPHSRGVT